MSARGRPHSRSASCPLPAPLSPAMNPEEPEDDSPDRVAESRVAYAPHRDEEEDMSMDDIELIEHAARILQTSGDTAAALRRAMHESIVANESVAVVPRSSASEEDSAVDVELNGVDVLSMGPNDDIEFEPPRLRATTSRRSVAARTVRLTSRGVHPRHECRLRTPKGQIGSSRPNATPSSRLPPSSTVVPWSRATNPISWERARYCSIHGKDERVPVAKVGARDLQGVS